jgi:hypothetical protein
VRPPRGDVRDHVDLYESDHRLSYPFYGAVQPQNYLEVRVRENFEAARFSTFSTVSTLTGHAASRYSNRPVGKGSNFARSRSQSSGRHFS